MISTRGRYALNIMLDILEHDNGMPDYLEAVEAQTAGTI